jgi:hypothetical protein
MAAIPRNPRRVQMGFAEPERSIADAAVEKFLNKKLNREERRQFMAVYGSF